MKRNNVVIDKYTFDFANHQRDALSKARLDVNKTFELIGALVLTIRVKISRVRLLGIISNLWQYIKCIVKIPRCSNVYIQYPALSSRINYYNLLIKYAKLRRCKIIYIIHDVESLRFSVNDRDREVEVLNLADILIVHTEAMEQKLLEFGVKASMVVLGLFDYYCKAEQECKDAQICHVAFAGNLSKYKSKFIAKLITMAPQYVKYRFYGMPNELDFSNSTNSEYCGSFLPEHVSELNASWGLVWDGDELEFCSGIGQYLRYNASHKLSLYIAAGLPLIVWSQSGIADYVRTEQIGICVDSLLSLDDIISNVTMEEYNNMKRRVVALSQDLTNGKLLLSAINKCETKLSAR